MEEAEGAEGDEGGVFVGEVVDGVPWVEAEFPLGVEEEVVVDELREGVDGGEG